ncbi:MAG: hypothetical protein QM687_08440 [Ferruginibacter sp.]
MKLLKRNLLMAVLLSMSQLLYSQDSQDITGLWRSEDGTRLYEIKIDNDVYTAVLVQSSREKDKQGASILDNVQYKKSKDIYEGAIISADDATAALAKISLKGDELHFKIKRLFFDYVNIKWLRVRLHEDKTTGL